jgi:arylsulfatase A-like enzyme
MSGIVVACAAADAPAARVAPRKPPNVVIIVADDYRAEDVGYRGHAEVRTPNIDRLAKQGVVFRHAYVSAADQGSVCTPSRTQLHSGRTLYHWFPKSKPAEKDPAGYSLGRAFREAGFATLRTGKGVNVPSPLNAEFERNVEGSELKLGDHLDNAVPFIRENAGKKPFLLVFEPRIPHSPYESTAKTQALFPPDKVALPPEYLPQHPFLKVEWGRGALGLDADGKQLPTPPPDQQIWSEQLARATLAKYYASIAYLDEGVGKIVATLRERGALENTYLVFVGDNGLSISHHGLFAKSDLYENGGLHVPMTILGPGISHRETGSFTYMIDVFPTVCDLAGIAIPARVDGISLKPLLLGQTDSLRNVGFTAFRDEQFAINDGRWKLIRFPRLNRVQLFDLAGDPRELKDLSAEPAHAERIRQLSALMDKEKAAAGFFWPLGQGTRETPD